MFLHQNSTVFWRHNIQSNDTQPNSTHNDDTMYNETRSVSVSSPKLSCFLEPDDTRHNDTQPNKIWQNDNEYYYTWHNESGFVNVSSLNPTTFSLMTLSQIALRLMTLSTIKLVQSIFLLQNSAVFWCHDCQPIDTQLNDTQPNKIWQPVACSL